VLYNHTWQRHDDQQRDTLINVEPREFHSLWTTSTTN